MGVYPAIGMARRTERTPGPNIIYDRIRYSTAVYAKDPSDSDNLMRWGRALLDLSLYQRPLVARKMLRDAVSKFEESLKVNNSPAKSETHWGLGESLTKLGILVPHADDARRYFSKAREHYTFACEMEPHNRVYRMSLKLATDYFTTACEVNPCNGLYHESMEMAAKAPELHAERIQKQAPSSSSSPKAATKKEQSSVLIYGMGLFSLAIIALVRLGILKKSMPSPTSSTRG